MSADRTAAEHRPQLTRGRLFVYALPAAPIAALGLPMAVHLPPLAVGWAVARVPERRTLPPESMPMQQALNALLESRPVRMVLAADLLGGFALGLVTSMFLFLAEDALGLREVSSLLLLAYFISGVSFVPLVLRLARRFG